MATILRTRATWTGVAGTPGYSNLYWNAAPGGAQDAIDKHAAFLGAVDALQRSSVSWSTDSTTALIDSLTGDITGLQGVTPASGVGASASDMLPPATNILVHLRTGIFQGGREIRGRIFLPYFTEPASGSDGTVVSGTVSAIVAALGPLIAPVPGPELLVWSRLTGAVPVVAQATVNTKFAVLRSRRD